MTMEVISLLAGLVIAIWIVAFPARPYYRRPKIER